MIGSPVGAVLLPLALLGASALVPLLLRRSERIALAAGSAATSLACAVGAGVALNLLLTGAAGSGAAAWPLPVGELRIAVDALSSFFLLCIFVVSGLAAVYGAGYLRAFAGRRSVVPALFFFDLLVASMVLVAVARNGILFLLAWEVMTLSSFFLVTFQSEREEVRRAGMTYLIASQLGVVFLFVLFAVLGGGAANYDFDRMLAAGSPGPATAGLCFLLALVGFGTKAGFWPVHIWLPDAHPAAPSHVSAVMSGVMIKMGIYGLLRTLTFLGDPPDWWGALLIGVGAVSGVAGVLHALAQHDLKRLLAYHSVENIGIIAMGIGVGLLGQTHGNAGVRFLGFAGALLHVLNHGLFKGLLFQGAGSVLHGTGTRSLDALGGLYRRMPVTATAFLAGSVAICGLPPLNGFVSEWLIYVGGFRAGGSLPTGPAAWGLVTLPALALIGGLAAACFVKAFGIVFLGQARTAAATKAHEAGLAMRAPMIAGSLFCLVIGLWPAGAVRLVAPAAAALGARGGLPDAGPLAGIARAGAVLLAVVGALALVRLALLRGRPVELGETWGCGYAAPTPRMQYTAASFAQPILTLFSPVIHSRVEKHGPDGYFPAAASYEEHLGDMAGERVLAPATRRVIRALSRLRVIQQGRLQLYLVYVAVTLVVLLVWQLAGSRK